MPTIDVALEAGTGSNTTPSSVAPARRRLSAKRWVFGSHCVQYALVPLAVLVIWEVLARCGIVRAIMLPAPSTISATLWNLASTGLLFVHIGASIARVLQGFCIAACAGLTIGIAAGIFPAAARLTDVPIQVVRPIPPIAWIPLAILWFGIGETSKIFVIYLGAFFPIVLATIEGIRQTDSKFVELGRVLEVPRGKFVRRVIIPGSLPAIITGLRVGLGNAWVCVVAAELIAAERGIGYVIVDGRELSRPDLVIAGMLSIGVVGKLMDVILKALERRMIRWKSQYVGG